MRIHTQEPGIRPWYGNDFIDLQAEVLKAVLAVAGAAEQSCIMQGCEFSVNGGTLDIQEGLVCLFDQGSPHIATVSAMSVEITQNRVWLVPYAEVINRTYVDGQDKQVVIVRKAQLQSSATQPISGALMVYDNDAPEYRAPLFKDIVGSTSTPAAGRSLRLMTDAPVFPLSVIPNIPANHVSSGVLAVERIPDLPAEKITSGQLHIDRIPDIPVAKIIDLDIPTTINNLVAANNIPTKDYVDNIVTQNIVDRIDNRVQALRPEADYKNPSVSSIKDQVVSQIDADYARKTEIPSILDLEGQLASRIALLEQTEQDLLTRIATAEANLNDINSTVDSRINAMVDLRISTIEGKILSLEDDVKEATNFAAKVETAIAAEKENIKTILGIV